jgi:hypothetical protein
VSAAPLTAFVVRLRDLMSTLEASTIIANVESRVRGLREQLQFACIALPCDEALVAIEREAFGRLHVPVVVRADDWAEPGIDFLAPGTPFAQLLAGGEPFAQSIHDDDPALEPLRGALRSRPRSACFSPVRCGSAVVGGVALLRDAESGDREVRLAQHLGHVLSMTIETFRTERVLFELFARSLADVLAPEIGTTLGASLERTVRTLRVDPEYARKLRLALLCGAVASRGVTEAQLVTDVLERFDRYFAGLERAPGRLDDLRGSE